MRNGLICESPKSSNIDVEGVDKEEESQMEAKQESDTVGGGEVSGTHWWWALASTAQLGWGIFSFRRGCSGDSRLMPVKAFGVASLFVGSAASASVAFLQASGIYKVEDLLEVGANLRTRLGIRPRTHNQKTDDL